MRPREIPAAGNDTQRPVKLMMALMLLRTRPMASLERMSLKRHASH
jgi:hypothetical protein